MGLGEACDGNDLAGQTCSDLGFFAGVLSCDFSCALDAADCNDCGDSIRDTGEQCDGADLDGATCASLGLLSGVLGCTGACVYDTTGCAQCGNGVLEAGEECDGGELGGWTCASLGFAGGTLGCHASCQYDTTGCVGCTAVADLISQDGCLAGEHCTLVGVSWPVHIGCAPVGSTAHYDHCSTMTECMAGATCAGTVTDFWCMPFCDPGNPSCPGAGICLYEMETIDGPVGLCVLPDSCDPLANTGCAAGEACYIIDAPGNAKCFTAGSQGVGVLCNYTNQCAGGMVCHGGTCTELCASTVNCTTGTCQDIGTMSQLPTIGTCQ